MLELFGFGALNPPSQYYTVIFGVSRALGCLTQLVWSRGACVVS